MTPLRQTAFRIPDELIEAMLRIKERDGVPISEQVRRAIIAWVELKSVSAAKPARKQAITRKRS